MNLFNQSISSIFMRKSGRTPRRKPPHSETGYALIALIGIMTFAMILTTAAAPQIKKELQREREEEMLWRAGQVIYAIQRLNPQPVMGEEGLMKLANGIQVPGNINKIKYLRSSALCDPLASTPCPPGGSGTNWQLIHPGDSAAKDFLSKYKSVLDRLKLEGKLSDQQYVQYLAGWQENNALLGVVIGGDSQAGGNKTGNDAQINDQVNDQNPDSGPDNKKNLRVLGVVSSKSDKMFRNYYDAQQYNEAFFFQRIPLRAGGFVSPLLLGDVGGLGGATAGPDPRCPNGGVFIGDKCYGGVAPICRDAAGKGIPCPPSPQ